MPSEARASTALPVRDEGQPKSKVPTWYSPFEDQDQSPGRGPSRLPSIQQLLDAPTTTIGRLYNSSRPLVPPSPGPSVRPEPFAPTPVPVRSYYEPEEQDRLAPPDTGLIATASSPIVSTSRAPSRERSESQRDSSFAPPDSGLVRYPQQGQFYRYVRDESNDYGDDEEDIIAQVGVAGYHAAPVDDLDVGVGGELDEDSQMTIPTTTKTIPTTSMKLTNPTTAAGRYKTLRASE